ncbi:MAG: AMP-binding protein, partial [Saprospiraceae bacterium]|nr:AMP-binding protein [Saprospiraceae bacterium]
LTFKEIDKMSDQFGAYLQSRGVEPGDRVALMMPNLLQYPIALFGCIKAGIIIVNTNPLYTPREMEHQFTDSQVKAIVIAENFAANLEKVIGKTDIKTVITTSIGELLRGMKGWVTDLAVKRIKKMVPKYNIPNTVKFKDALKQGKKFELNTDFANEPDTVIVHQYTGGTTGVSKGAMLTNKNLVSNMLQLSAIFKPYMTKDVERIVLCPLPLYHIYAFSCNCLAMMDTGSLSVLITNPRDLSTIIKEFNRYKVTGMTGVNTLYNGLNNHPDLKDVDLSHMEFASAGGTALQNAVAQEWEKNTGTIISEGFGMTETSPVASSNPKGGVRIGTIGIPVPSTDMRIVDDAGKPIATGEIGEIQVKGPQVMKGYYNRPDETAKTITSEGWLNTGDIGQMDEDGYFKIVDRKKDMINVSGFNVYPNEIEDVVAMHKKVDEVACIGVEDDKSGEVVKVFIVKKDKSLNEKEIIEHCREYLTGYKIPKQIAFMDDLPKSTVGKILRRELRGK